MTVTTLAALLLAAAAAAGAADGRADGRAGGELRAAGEQRFAHRCGMCHRDGGTGTFILARRLGAANSLLEQRRDLKPEYIRFVVRWGLVNMPRITRVEMSDKDLDAVIAYLAPAP